MAVFTDRHGSSLPIATTTLLFLAHTNPSLVSTCKEQLLPLFYTSKKGHRLKATLRSNMEKLVTDIATNLIIANYFFFLSRISSTTITTRHRALLTTNGILAVRTPDSIQPKLPMLTSIFTVIGFLASIPLARKKVAIQPKICDKIYNIYPPFFLVYNKKATVIGSFS